MSKLPLEQWPLAISEEPARSTIEDTVRSRVTILKGGVGLKIADETSLDESLHILDWTTTLSDHVGFMIGDALNFGESKWGQKYVQALNQTRRARSTLKNYAWVARNIPPEKRKPVLTFSHHQEILRLDDQTKRDEVLQEVAKQAENENAPSVKELRKKVKKLAPPKVKTPAKAKKQSIPDRVSYEPDAEEQSHLDVAEAALEEATQAIKESGVLKILSQQDTTEKRRWLSMLEPFFTLYNQLRRYTR